MIIFDFIEYKNDRIVAASFGHHMGDDVNVNFDQTSIKHLEKADTRPYGSYSEVRRYHVQTTQTTRELVVNAYRNQEGLEDLTNKIEEWEPIKVEYYQDSKDKEIADSINKSFYEELGMSRLRRTDSTVGLIRIFKTNKEENKIKLAKVFPENTYIGQILNDGLYLSSTEFEVKYSYVAKKSENITKKFGNPAVKYTIKSNIFSDSEVIIYERDNSDCDVSVGHLCTDGIHWKNINDYMESKEEFQLLEDSQLEKKYQILQNDSLPLPPEIEFIRVLCSAENKVAIVWLNIIFK